MEEKDQSVEKKVDESYKKSVDKGKDKQEQEESKESGNQALPEVNFPIFLSSIGMQAMMCLGQIENPVTHKKEVNLEQTKYFIDILKMLQEKTKGNLNQDEEKMLEELVYQLQISFVDKKK